MKTKEEKQNILRDLRDKFSKATSIIVVNLKGLKTNDQRKIREVLRQSECIFQVAKKTLIFKVKPDFPLSDEALKFPFALIWGFDHSASAFRSLKLLKNGGITLDIAGGYLMDRILTTEQVWQLSELPTKEELIQKLSGILKHQISNLVFSLKFPLQKMVIILSQVKSSKK
ncbi:MAG: 50S ribosomal protein L10 [Patescibacteria group bacterium]|nr:50S ribosomal protein L10 [Patescibacteria group bacterium]